MAVRIDRADVSDLHQVLADHARYWGERDLRALHLTALVKEFGSTCLVAAPRTASGATSSASSPPTAPATSI